MKFLFIGGTGRCGTTEAARLIGAHPRIFRIKRELRYDPGDPVKQGEWRQRWARFVTEARSQNCECVLEKSPGNAFLARKLAKYFGRDGSEVFYLHITRDEEATLNSLLRIPEDGTLPRRYPVPNLGRPANREEAMLYCAFVNTVGANRAREFGARGRVQRIETLNVRDVWKWLEVTQAPDESGA